MDFCHPVVVGALLLSIPSGKLKTQSGVLMDCLDASGPDVLKERGQSKAIAINEVLSSLFGLLRSRTRTARGSVEENKG